MNIQERFTAILNCALNQEGAGIEYFESILTKMVNENGIKLVLADFQTFNKKKLIEAQKEVSEGVMLQNSKWVAWWHKVELKCKNMIELRQKYQINESCFIYEDGYLLFCCLGTGFNDDIVRGLYLSKYNMKKSA